MTRLSCILDASTTVAPSDKKLIEDNYSKDQFIKISSVSGDNVNGQKAKKFQLTIDDNKATNFANGLSGLSFVKSINSCEPKTNQLTNTNLHGDNKTTPITVWVDPSAKRVVLVQSHLAKRAPSY
jgi:hypothetical protein